MKARSTYVGVTGSKHLIFKCHRDGKYKPKGKNIRKLKSLGTNKIGCHCPARMDVMVEDNDVSVLYIKTHFGHDLEPKRLTLTHTEKEFLAEQLLLPNTNYDDILNVVKTLDSTSRLHYLTRKDLIKIKNSLKETAKKNNNSMKIIENNDKSNDTVEINNVFDGDFESLFDYESHEKSPPSLKNDDVSKHDKQDLVNFTNTLSASSHIDIKDSYTNKIVPIYELNAEQQLIDQNEQIPILEFNPEVSKLLLKF